MPPQYDASDAAHGKKNMAGLSPPSPTTSVKGSDVDSGIRASLAATPLYQDVWATFLFVVHIITIFIAFGFNISNLRTSNRPDATPVFSPGFKEAAFFTVGISGLISIGVVMIYMLLMFKFPRAMVIGSFIASMALWVGAGVMYLIHGVVVAGVVFLLLAALNGLLVYMWRRRIPMSSLLLETSVSVLKRYPSTVAAAVVQYLVLLGYVCLFSATLAAIKAGKYSQGIDLVLTIYLAFSFFWTTQVLTNVVHVIVSGVFATFYFVVGPSQAVSNPTLASARRALTYSFGSIAFGSLVVAAIQTLRFVLNLFRDDNCFVGSCIDCLLGIIEGLAQYFNYYAFTQVAIYGKPYVRAAKDTWNLVKRSGAEVIINDNLLGNVFGIATLVAAAIGATSGYLIIFKRDGLTDSEIAGVTVICALLGLVTMSLVTETIQSGVSTTIVCYCEDPDALRRSKPEMYTRFHNATHARSATERV